MNNTGLHDSIITVMHIMGLFSHNRHCRPQEYHHPL